MTIYPFNFSNPINVDCDWDAFYYSDILDPVFFKKIQSEFNQIDWIKNEISERKKGGDFESNWFALDQDHECFDYFTSYELINFIQDKIKEKIEDYSIHINYKYDAPNYPMQGKHRDVGVSFLTFQIFLQEEDYPDGGTILHSQDRDFELPMLRNSGGFFKNTMESLHSVSQRGYHRKSLLVRYKNKS